LAFAVKQCDETDRRIGRKAGGMDERIQHRIRAG
jgi:hypothetical protein